MDFAEILKYFATAGLNLGLKILGALVVLFIGRWVIRIVVRLMKAALERQNVEPTLRGYVGTLVSVLLNIALFIAILGYFGFETTTFAALLAGVGVAIGAAWSGLLANFAAGVFLIVIRPFKVGDTVSAGGVTGVVERIGMFFTHLHTIDNIIAYVGNNKILSDNIQNFSDTPYRRVDLKVQLKPETDPIGFMNRLKTGLANIPNVLTEPAPQIGILEVTREGTTVAVRPFAHNRHSDQVQFDANRIIIELLSGEPRK
jgi:small conductance mechanosensitive channel